MKVGVELQPFLKSKTGIGTYTYELITRLQEKEGITLSGNIFNFLNRNDISKAVENIKFNTETCKLFPYGVYSRMWEHLPFTYNNIFKEQVDLYHFFNFLVPKKIEGKVITTIHDLTFLLYPETMQAKNLERLKRNLDYAIERADKIVTISESSKAGLIEYMKIPSDKIKIIYPGVDEKAFSTEYTKQQREFVREKYGLPNEYILYMGTLEPRKNINSIIEAFAQLRKEAPQEIQSIKLVLAGKKGWLYKEIFNRIEELKLQEDVIFTDYVEEKDKPLIYQLAKLFIFPSLYEGFGIPVLEAMAARVPVITANNSSLPEAAGDAALLVNAKSIYEIAEAMAKILLDEELRKRKIIQGMEQVQKFSWEESSNRLLELYQEIIS